jgi:hypothetical protein
MPRVVTLKDRVKQIIRKYKHINPSRFVYNKKSEYSKKYKRIRVWFLIHDKKRGYSIFIYELKRKSIFSVIEWTGLLQKNYGGYESIYSVFTQSILPAINNKSGAAWRFISLIAWTGLNDIRQVKNPAGSMRGNKAVKKGNANARNTARRR